MPGLADTPMPGLCLQTPHIAASSKARFAFPLPLPPGRWQQRRQHQPDCTGIPAQSLVWALRWLGSLMILPMAMVRPSSRSVKRPCSI